MEMFNSLKHWRATWLGWNEVSLSIFTMMEWTKPYHGITHLGDRSSRKWATVTTLQNDHHILSLIDRDNKPFHPKEETHTDLAVAKAHGAAWVAQGRSAMDNLTELPKTHPNWKGTPERIQWPKGRAIVRCGNVYLFHQRKNEFAVVYGLQVGEHQDRDTAAKNFGQCVFHQAECEGLI